MLANVYRGRRTESGAQVLADGAPLHFYLEVSSHSPTGFEWGYNGSGPAQLALAICADALGVRPGDTWRGNLEPAIDPTVTLLDVYQAFKRRTVAQWQADEWELHRGEVMEHIHRILSDSRRRAVAP